MKQVALVFLGAVAGGIAGYLLFIWLARQGLYGLMIPGALVGLGAGYFRNRYLWTAFACGLLALGITLYAEWQFAPFADDESLAFFLTHLHEKSAIKLLMIALGTLIGFWGPFSRYRQERAAGVLLTQRPEERS